MEPDFHGWATKAGLKCNDGLTIMGGAFKHQDKMKVPLVWQHGHGTPENVLGHAILENRGDEGVYAYGYFNKTPQAEIARELLEHGDVTMMSIWANQLVEKSKRIFHGAIREVSLVISGANPGALIEHVTLRHGEGMEELLDDEVVIYTGIPIEHEGVEHATATEEKTEDDEDVDEETLQDVYDTMTEKQKQVVHYMLAKAASGSLTHAILDDAEDKTFKEIYEGMDDQQKTMVHYLLGEASAKAGVTHSAMGTEGDEGADDGTDTGTETEEETDTGTDTDEIDDSKGTEMKHHNLFEDKDADGSKPARVLSHTEREGILADAMKVGSLKEAVERFAQEHLEHGIQDIDTLFPEARTLADTPELFSRRTEWVADVMSQVRKSPFSRVKTISADITVAEARAKGYVTGDLKKEEFFRVSKRITEPTTIYKKQKLDRDDMIDITDFDVVAWLKGEMRLMLDEELARAILLGDGRPGDDEDKINEEKIRPVATDHELYVTTVNVNLGNANSSHREILDAIVRNRRHLRGSGLPTMYTTESVIAEFMLLRDQVGRAIYATLDEVAAQLRVRKIVPVEVMEEYDDLLAIIVNLNDYVVGADRGGNVAMFDDFDIDYNQYKYLIETRASGALVKLKAALVVRGTAAGSVEIAATEPDFDPATGELTIVDTANVTYRNAATDEVMTAALSPYAVPDGETVTVVAEAAPGFHFADSEQDDWSFTNPV